MAEHDSDTLLYTTLLFVSIVINYVCRDEIGSQILCLGMYLSRAEDGVCLALHP